jgi:amidase
MFMLTNATLAMVLTLAQACTPATTEDPSAIDITKLTVMDLRQRLASGELSATRTTHAYLERISRLDKAGPKLNAIIEINPDAPAIATSLDEQLAAGGPLGPLHGLRLAQR